ncbi:CxxC motif protein [Halorubrum virus Humcor2]|nr:CxxC motif protein [Halorubrum virus Humcor2]
MSLSDGSTGPALTTDGPGEFWCPACGCRCTRNSSSQLEYGHALDCPRRPDDLTAPER